MSALQVRPVATGRGARLLGLIVYAWWERVSTHPMTPPRLAGNRPLFGLNLATLLIYGAASIMFFLLPFDLAGPISVFHRSSTSLQIKT